MSAEKWYVRNPDGRVFGPVDEERLVAWAVDGRIEPFAGVSTDRANWMLASLKPELGMDWIVENEPGNFYGPTNRAVVDDLIANGALAEGCRIYRDDKGGEFLQYAAAVEEKDEALAQYAAAFEAKEAELAQCRAALEAKEAELAQCRAECEAKEAELAQGRAALEAKDAELVQAEARMTELQAQFAKLTETRQRAWKTEVVEPEIVEAEPPPTVREVFTPGRERALADLERQAQMELARMGVDGAKRFFGFGTKR